MLAQDVVDRDAFEHVAASRIDLHFHRPIADHTKLRRDFFGRDPAAAPEVPVTATVGLVAVERLSADPASAAAAVSVAASATDVDIDWVEGNRRFRPSVAVFGKLLYFLL